MAQDPARGAVAVRTPKKSPLGWLVPVAILLLLAIIAVVALLLLNANDKGDDPGIDIEDDPQSMQVIDPQPIYQLVA